MATTVHERASDLAKAARCVDSSTEHITRVYLQALLDDAETVEACSKAYLNAAIEKDPDFEIMGRVHCAMKEALATLKRMGGV